MSEIVSLVELIAPVQATASGASVYERFNQEPDVLAIAVVDDANRPIGIVERNSFCLSMAAEYGRALYGRRPISVLMNAKPLIVDAEAELVSFTGEVLAERPSELLQGFIVVKDGRYAGIGSALSLLQAANRANKAQALEMTQLAQTLQRAQVEAQSALQAKSQFLAVMSHEIRTPLNGVLAVAEIMSHRLRQEELRPFVQTILDSGETLLRLLTDALDFSRADAGQMEMQSQPFRVGRLLDQVRDLWTARALERGLSIDMRYDGPDDLWAMGDAVRLKQVVNNLIGNALKFTDQGGVEVVLRAREDGFHVRLQAEVGDTGPGVAEASLKSIFQPFVQDDAGRAKGGAGLGLSICRELVERMDGTIQARNRPTGGLIVNFEAVLARVPGAEGVIDRPAEAEPLRAESAFHVLIADDNATNRLVAETLCGMFGYSCQSVADGAEAVTAVSTDAFDLILMDIKMPVMGGLEATRLIRGEADGGKRIPILALTANADPRDAASYINAGMDGVVEKPIKPEALLAAITQAMGGAASRSQRIHAAA